MSLSANARDSPSGAASGSAVALGLFLLLSSAVAGAQPVTLGELQVAQYVKRLAEASSHSPVGRGAKRCQVPAHLSVPFASYLAERWTPQGDLKVLGERSERGCAVEGFGRHGLLRGQGNGRVVALRLAKQNVAGSSVAGLPALPSVAGWPPPPEDRGRLPLRSPAKLLATLDEGAPWRPHVALLCWPGEAAWPAPASPGSSGVALPDLDPQRCEWWLLPLAVPGEPQAPNVGTAFMLHGLHCGPRDTRGGCSQGSFASVQEGGWTDPTTPQVVARLSELLDPAWRGGAAANVAATPPQPIPGPADSGPEPPDEPLEPHQQAALCARFQQWAEALGLSVSCEPVSAGVADLAEPALGDGPHPRPPGPPAAQGPSVKVVVGRAPSAQACATLGVLVRALQGCLGRPVRVEGGCGVGRAH